MKLIFLVFILLGNNFSSKIVDGLRAEEIVGGSPARVRQFKYAVAIRYKVPGEEDRNPCVGTILGKMHIATVAHCFFEKPAGLLRNYHFYVTAGVLNLTSPRDWINDFDIDQVIIHSSYNPFSPDTYAEMGNIAIVKLARVMPLQPSHPFLAQLYPRQKLIKEFDQEFFVSGYGYQTVEYYLVEYNGQTQYMQEGSADGSLQYARATVLSDQECVDKILEDIAPGNMCVRSKRTQPDKPTGICVGDSGAPLTHHQYLDGIAINGFVACDEYQMPAIFINVPFYYRFIKDALDDITSENMFVLQQKTNDQGQYTFEQIPIII